MQLINQGKIEQALDWAYDTPANGIVGFDSTFRVAESYMTGDAPNFEILGTRRR